MNLWILSCFSKANLCWGYVLVWITLGAVSLRDQCVYSLAGIKVSWSQGAMQSEFGSILGRRAQLQLHSCDCSFKLCASFVTAFYVAARFQAKQYCSGILQQLEQTFSWMHRNVQQHDGGFIAILSLYRSTVPNQQPVTPSTQDKDFDITELSGWLGIYCR